MATRSVYEISDVAATLLYALQKHDYTLVFQTARELRISGESELLTNLIIFAWLLCDPFVCSLCEPPTADTIYESLCQIAPAFPTSLPEYYTPFPFQPPAEHQTEVFNAAVHTCISKGLWKHAYRILVPLLHTNQFDRIARLFEPYNVSKTHFVVLESLLYVPLAERLLLHSIVVATGVQRRNPVVVTKYGTIWNKPALGGRGDRCFSIPAEARRLWNIQPKSVDRIQFSLLPPAIVDSQASLYWLNAIKEPKTEEWYATYFPDDIPDEWTTEECTKSHVVTNDIGSSGEKIHTNIWTAAFHVCWT